MRLVALARQLTADPDFANKAFSGKSTDITPCIRCYKCFPGPLEDNMDNLSAYFGCTVNPRAFFFDDKVLSSNPTGSRNVLVVGGGVGGMEAAVTLADRGHRVTLMEKSGRLGGIVNFADVDVNKGDLGKFKDLLVRRVGERDIKVLLRKKCTPEDIASSGADAVILAVGSSPAAPPIRGIESAVRALDIYKDIERIGENVVIVGGGLVGCEAGLHLAKNGKKVTIVEMSDKVAPDSYPMHRISLMNELDKMVALKTGLKCTKIASNGVTVDDENNREMFLPADTVVYALGMNANRTETEKQRAAAKGVPVYEIGDCVKAGKVYDAVRGGFVAAMSIL
jgi:NADPH-dependent 2,4-dienoyl-CoA reductase/sulfur reductase-like enzyme